MSMRELTLHVQIKGIPNKYMDDNNYCSTMEYVEDKINELVEDLEGCLADLEIK